MLRRSNARKTLIQSLAVATLFLLAGCGGGGATNSDNANYVDVNFDDSSSGAPTAVVTAANDAPAVTAVGDDQLGNLVAIYDSYLNIRSSVIMGDRDIAELSSVATLTAIEQVGELRAINETKHNEGTYSALTGLKEWSNVTTIHEQGDGFVFTDCTERQGLNSVGSRSILFVTNEVTMVPDNESYKIDQVTELQNGLFAESFGDVGCVPPSFVKRAETIAAQAVGDVAAMTANPTSALGNGLSPVLASEAREELEFALAYLVDENLSRTADESVNISVVGMDVNKPEFTVIVSVCRYYPNGRFYTNTETGQATVPDLTRGSSEEEWLYVSLESGPAGSSLTDTVVTVEPHSLNCWEG